MMSGAGGFWRGNAPTAGCGGSLDTTAGTAACVVRVIISPSLRKWWTAVGLLFNRTAPDFIIFWIWERETSGNWVTKNLSRRWPAWSVVMLYIGGIAILFQEGEGPLFGLDFSF